MERKEFDDITLSAFVDDQVDTVRAEMIIQAMEENPEVRERVYQFRRAKDLMKLSFKDLKAPLKTPAASGSRRWRLPQFSGLAAAVLALVIGTSSGLLGFYTGKQINESGAVTLAQNHQDRLILHISESNPAHFARALAFVKTFLTEHEKQGEGQIEVVAHAGGLDLLREGVSPYENEVKALMKKHANVHFIACAAGIRGLLKKGITPNIIEGIATDETAFDHIVAKLQAGWSYVKVQSLAEI
jgi:intracellular sulfur oxidation DsrE/DsrF family protein